MNPFAALSTPTAPPAESRREPAETALEARFAPFAARMRQDGLPTILIDTFREHYRQLLAGATGLIAEEEIRPVPELPDAETLPAHLAEIGQQALPKTILLKLNGGLGTGMGLERAKSLLVVKEGLTFLDVIARQALHAGAPLVLMNSFATRDDSLPLLQRYPGLNGAIPLDFLQHHAPKVRCSDLAPVEWPANPDLEWAPPGHGDIYTALVTSGMLETLLRHGYEYAFVSNADNLGAVMDARLLGYFVAHKLPLMMECADRTPMDRKGGHLAQTLTGQLLLRESAQCPPQDVAHFQDISRHRYFNTNNLWLHLPTLQALLAARGHILGLPLIRNAKTVDPRDPTSTPVYQLETAMGSAIATMPGAGAIRVPRSRFAPVKSSNDLLAVRSDAYVLTPEHHIIPNPQRRGELVVDLDPRFYRLVDDLEARFPQGAPSLLACTSLTVRGDVRFGAGVRLVGQVLIEAAEGEQREIPAGACLGQA